MISFGIQLGGPDQDGIAIDKALINAAQTAERVRASNYNDGTEAWINPIFIVPGSIWKPEFSGYEFGFFSRKKKGLVVKIAVPQSVVNGDGIPEFIASSLREAVRLAATHFASKGISFSTLKAEKIILAIEAGLQQTSP